MFFLIFGWGKKAKALGAGPIGECTRCRNVARRIVLERVAYFSLFFIPVIRKSRFLEVCSVCHHGYELESRQAAHQRLAEAHTQSVLPAEAPAKSKPTEVRQCLQCGWLVAADTQECSNCGTGPNRPLVEVEPSIRTATG